MQKRKMSRDLKVEVMEAALVVAQTMTIPSLTREAVAERANVSTGAVSSHYGTMHAFRKAVARRAVKEEMIDLLVPLLTSDKYGGLLKGDLRAKAIEQLRV
tara:strand:- start:2851 stop:3153 length:303 start_codon:yes stop_codon:yes gene_type:complete